MELFKRTISRTKNSLVSLPCEAAVKRKKKKGKRRKLPNVGRKLFISIYSRSFFLPVSVHRLMKSKHARHSYLNEYVASVFKLADLEKEIEGDLKKWQTTGKGESLFTVSRKILSYQSRLLISKGACLKRISNRKCFQSCDRNFHAFDNSEDRSTISHISRVNFTTLTDEISPLTWSSFAHFANESLTWKSSIVFLTT